MRGLHFCSDQHQHSFQISNMRESSSLLSSLFFCLFFLFVVERKNERTVLEHPLCRAGTRCQYVSNKEDSRLGGKRDPGGLTRRALAAVLRYCLASIIDSFCRLCCMDVLVTY